MADSGPRPISVAASLDALSFLADRTPTTADDDGRDAFGRLADYRDGGIFVGHWAGASEWERHTVGDEIVHVVEGETTMFFLIDGVEHPTTLTAGDLVVVPQGTWHRFETPVAVKVLSVTPQPTDHHASTSIPDH